MYICPVTVLRGEVVKGLFILGYDHWWYVCEGDTERLQVRRALYRTRTAFYEPDCHQWEMNQKVYEKEESPWDDWMGCYRVCTHWSQGEWVELEFLVQTIQWDPSLVGSDVKFRCNCLNQTVTGTVIEALRCGDIQCVFEGPDPVDHSQRRVRISQESGRQFGPSGSCIRVA